MASTDKTPNIDLNQWISSDNVLMEDFNSDNAKLEAAFAAAAPVFGSYNARFPPSEAIHINLGFKPRVLILSGRERVEYESLPLYRLASPTVGTSGLSFTTTGFSVVGALNLNGTGTNPYRYLAFR